MRKLTLATLLASVWIAQSAFAQNLGRLTGDQAPQRLVPATEFQNLGEHQNYDRENYDRDRYDHDWDHDWDYGYRYPYYNPYYYPSYYYPYYGYGYGYGHGHDRWIDEPEQLPGEAYPGQVPDANTPIPASGPIEPSQTPIVCFASDQSGNWFAHADRALNVTQAQETANRECSASGGNCHQNLGCAVAVGDRNASHR